jgi:hypothetical protein
MSVPQPDKPVVPLRVPRATIEAFRATEPLFTEFLLETGRVVIENLPGKPAAARNDHGIKSSSL